MLLTLKSNLRSVASRFKKLSLLPQLSSKNPLSQKSKKRSPRFLSLGSSKIFLLELIQLLSMQLSSKALSRLQKLTHRITLELIRAYRRPQLELSNLALCKLWRSQQKATFCSLWPVMMEKFTTLVARKSTRSASKNTVKKTVVYSKSFTINLSQVS